MSSVQQAGGSSCKRDGLDTAILGNCLLCRHRELATLMLEVRDHWFVLDLHGGDMSAASASVAAPRHVAKPEHAPVHAFESLRLLEIS